MSIQRLLLFLATASVGLCPVYGQEAFRAPADPAPAEAPDAPAPDVAPQPESESASSTRSVWRGYIAMENRGFSQAPARPGQVRNSFSLVAQPEFTFESANRRHRINATLFGRFAAEPGYGSSDVREFNWQYRRDRWSLLAGMNRVFWGVAESRHVIDVINQSDMRENFVGDVKLGQLMVSASLQRSWGQIEFFVLPNFRTRRFPPAGDRPRLQLPLTKAEVANGGPPDSAVRISVSRGGVDLHAYYFHGVSREPDLIPVFEGDGPPTALKPVYRKMDQFAADFQFAHGAWLFKGEVMHRRKRNAQYEAGVGGFEYGISRLFGSASDLALLGEYQFDNRPDTEWPAPAKRGVFSGIRLALNDKASSEIKAGTVYDVSTHSWLVKAEFNRRLSNQWGLQFSYYGFSNVAKSVALRDFYRDSHLTITLRRYL
jgi:hypothetical protein